MLTKQKVEERAQNLVRKVKNNNNIVAVQTWFERFKIA